MLSRTFVCRTHWITWKQLYRGRLRSTTHRQLMQDVKQVKMIATLFILKKMMTTYSMARNPICSWYREIQNHYIRYIKTQNKSANLSMRHIKTNPIHKWMKCGKITTYLRLELWHWNFLAFWHVGISWNREIWWTDHVQKVFQWTHLGMGKMELWLQLVNVGSNSPLLGNIFEEL